MEYHYCRSSSFQGNEAKVLRAGAVHYADELDVMRRNYARGLLACSTTEVDHEDAIAYLSRTPLEP